MNDYPVGQQVTYRYYVGRYYLYQHQLRKAEKELEFAFRRCTRHHYKNKRHILIHLLTAKLILGYRPTSQLLERYKLVDLFGPLIQAMLSGNVAQYVTALDAHMEWFLRMKSYLLLKERGKVIVWRNLFRKVYLITREPNRNKIRMENCLIALRISTQDPSYDEMDTEALLVTLLDQGYMKGYLHHYQSIAVMSNQRPFPPVASVHVTTEVYDESQNQRDGT
ncbi:hypothetical protein BC938DRAFT_474998 [Jimgerdemannia flammicorona]|nr:hypothetical protein BC938DRAFT_474998 [Jimgerdemannia flammicorona]